ncbi:VacJ family lipoprotein [Zoogloea sp. LCSB751]|uniref:MlaA family lipoprotein n=1 Tax=Zoogloea sp. LCSB751 TaxID=1965277 RepID=UPI0020B13F44|nr:VacJ family lipoprotein [Zoogloea sp. LCSB751]
MKNSKPESMAAGHSILLALGLACTLAACAGPGGHPKDPLEPMNRATFRFNETADKYVVRPVAEVYDLAPLPVKTGVANFFGNIGDVWIGVNNLLQGKVVDGLSDGGRFLLNSTVGLLGVFDVATEIGLEKHDEDLGQTLGRWGVGDGPYVVLPLLGSSNVRDGLSLIGDFRFDPLMQLEDVGARNSVSGLRLISRRAALLGADTAADEAALDKYGYMRSFYMQYRRNQIYDGQPPREKDPDDEDADDGKSATATDAAAPGIDKSSSPDKKENLE